MNRKEEPKTIYVKPLAGPGKAPLGFLVVNGLHFRSIAIQPFRDIALVAIVSEKLFENAESPEKRLVFKSRMSLDDSYPDVQIKKRVSIINRALTAQVLLKQIDILSEKSDQITLEPHASLPVHASRVVRNILEGLKMNQMIKLLIAVIGFSSAVAYMLEEDFGDKFLPLTKIWHDQCIVITGAKQESIYAVREGIFDDNDEKMKRYIFFPSFI
ncbi:hypothetical protein JTB14_032371 [Gonioctena quinquepunctata]|nr:hypothetical protein JTB14_032371 [Gonioctena quinquepunctata]